MPDDKNETKRTPAGQLHKDLGIPDGERIPLSKLKEAAKGNGPAAARARMALWIRD